MRKNKGNLRGRSRGRDCRRLKAPHNSKKMISVNSFKVVITKKNPNKLKILKFKALIRNILLNLTNLYILRAIILTTIKEHKVKLIVKIKISHRRKYQLLTKIKRMNPLFTAKKGSVRKLSRPKSLI